MPYTPTNPSPNLLLIQSYFAALEEWDIEAVMSVLDNNYEHHILPLSMGRPVMDKQTYKEALVKIRALFQKYEIVVHEVTETSDVVTMHASSSALSVLGTPFLNEYMFTFHIRTSSTGERKICKIKEFVDSGYTKEWLHAETEKIAAQGKGEA